MEDGMTKKVQFAIDEWVPGFGFLYAVTYSGFESADAAIAHYRAVNASCGAIRASRQ
jgi:hypothetical protein